MQTDRFQDILLRLKREMQLDKDQEVAAALGMARAAFSERKRRDSFPLDRLTALAQERPDLGLDVEYIVTGIPSKERSREAVAVISSTPDTVTTIMSTQVSRTAMESIARAPYVEELARIAFFCNQRHLSSLLDIARALAVSSAWEAGSSGREKGSASPPPALKGRRTKKNAG